jgi:hypothetical protein
MSQTISEQPLEVTIVADLVKGHYVQRPPSAFDKALFPHFPPAQL